MNLLEELSSLCTSAKRTALLAQDNLTRKWYHIFSVIELFPSEVNDYNIPTNNWYKNKIVRSTVSSVDDMYSFYLIINSFDSVNNAIEIFNKPFDNNNIDGEINHYFNSVFVKEPTGSNPLVIASNLYENNNLSSILPKRNSGILVWCQIDAERKTENQIRSATFSNEAKAISQLTTDWLGFDIIAKPEHIGNVYLSIPNPYYRDIDVSLSSDPTGIFYHFKQRKGVTNKFKMRIIDKHGDYVTLDKLFAIQTSAGLIELPHEPQLVELHIYNSNDELIGIEGPFGFIKSINVGMSIKQADLRVTNSNGEQFTTEKFASERQINIGKTIDFNASYYFKNAEKEREYISQIKNRDFIFFGGGNTELEKIQIKAKAKADIIGILNNAKDSCFLCDPYFKVTDLVEYAYRIKSSSTSIKILNKRGKDFINKTDAQDLLEKIKEYNKLPFQKIECRMLKENLLHDRFIITDTSVWFLGSSFSEFGNRATCIGKVPESSDLLLIKQIEKWYYNDTYTQTIEDYINTPE